VLVVVPPPVGKLTDAAEMFRDADKKSRGLSEQYRRGTRQRGCALLDTGAVVVPSGADGIHLEAAEHHKLGAAVCVCAREIFG